jgi:hypothetical protein
MLQLYWVLHCHTLGPQSHCLPLQHRTVRLLLLLLLLLLFALPGVTLRLPLQEVTPPQHCLHLHLLLLPVLLVTWKAAHQERLGPVQHHQQQPLLLLLHATAVA